MCHFVNKVRKMCGWLSLPFLECWICAHLFLSQIQQMPRKKRARLVPTFFNNSKLLHHEIRTRYTKPHIKQNFVIIIKSNTTTLKTLLTLLKNEHDHVDEKYVEHHISVAMTYMDRIVDYHGYLSLNDCAIVFCFAVLIASKFLDDDYLTVADISNVVGMTVADGKVMELLVLKLLQWNAYISRENM